jgi:hypothetical protein
VITNAGAGSYFNWNSDITDFLGKYEAIPSCSLMYVEDCYFSYNRHSTDGLMGNWNVVRYNLFEHPYPSSGFGPVDNHGCGGGSWDSCRGEEVYNNTIVGAGVSLSNQLVEVRGGGGMVFNNTLKNSAYAVELANENPNTTWGNTYGILEKVKQLYIWGNTLANVPVLVLNDGAYVENTDYFLRTPTQAQDGFTYTPYSYPNPRTLG